jgi:hypothetical protein
MSFSRDAGDMSSALEYAEHMAGLAPKNSNLAALVRGLRQQVKKPGAP